MEKLCTEVVVVVVTDRKICLEWSEWLCASKGWVD